MEASHIDTLLAEAVALDEIERVQRSRHRLEDEYICKLQAIRRDVRPDASGIGTSILSDTMANQFDKEIRHRTHAQTEIAVLLDQIPRSDTWDKLFQYVQQVKVEVIAHETALNEARENLNERLFWERVRHAMSWCDIRVPQEDIKYRIAVDKLNDAKLQAFRFYQDKQRELTHFHQSRIHAISRLVSPANVDGQLSRDSTLTEDQLSTFSSPRMISDAPLNGNIRGSFALTRYTNYLNGEKSGYPVFGLSLRSMGGWLGKLILRHNCHDDILTPPLPIFTSVIPEVGGLTACVEAVFRMEELWDGDSGLEAALDQLVGVEDEEPVVDKGWILGFLLVNLPQPLIAIGEPLARSPYRGLRSDEIAYVLPTDVEMAFFQKIWRHTSITNIELGAAAITQRKDTERIVADIRSKWDIEVSKPIPAYRRRSQDTFWRRISRRSTSGDYSST